MSSLKIIGFDTNEQIVFEQTFNGNAFYENIFVQISDNLGLTKPTPKESENSRKGLELRLKRKLSKTQKELVLSKLEDQTLISILELTKYKYNVFYKDEIYDFINSLKGYTYGNLEDINSFFEEQEGDIPILEKLELEKVE